VTGNSKPALTEKLTTEGAVIHPEFKRTMLRARAGLLFDVKP
jgi:hypothetical protein